MFRVLKPRPELSLRALAFLFVFLSLSSHAEKALRVFAWSNLWGATEPCGCTLRPLGGLDIRLKKIKELTKKSKEDLLFIDGGRSLLPDLDGLPTPKHLEEAAKIIKETTASVGDWVFLLGDLDFKAGLEGLKNAQGPFKVLSNVEAPESLWQSSYSKNRDSGKLWLLSFVSNEFKHKGLKVADPQKVLKELIKNKNVQIQDQIIIGGSLSYDEILELARSQKDHKLIFVGGRFSSHRLEPVLIENYTYFANEAEGKNFWSFELPPSSALPIRQPRVHQVLK